MRSIPNLRWWIIVLLFGAAALNYIDRQALSALAPTIEKDLQMDDRDYANVVNLFFIAYTAAYIVSGRLCDKWGTRASMVTFVAWWSVANILTAAARGVTSLGAYRFLLGLGEAGVWPAASKAVSEWFPAKERALAIGIYTMGATIGAMFAPYFVIPIATHAYHETWPALANWLGQGAGWRLAFIITGAMGLIWLIPWLWLYREPKRSPHITDEEKHLLTTAEAVEAKAQPPGEPWTWRQVFAFRGMWLLLFGRLLTDPVWYFYQIWFPKYLNADRHLSQGQLTVTWAIYAAAGVGSLLGGWLSGRLIKRGRSAGASRMAIMAGCAAIMPASLLVAGTDNLHLMLAIASLTVLASLAWLINLSSLVVDIVPKHSLGTVFSIVAAGSTLGGILMNLIVATMVTGPSSKTPGFLDQAFQTVLGPLLDAVQGQGYGSWFLVMAFLHPLAWVILWLARVHRAPGAAA